jgi:hypothetical protein
MDKEFNLSLTDDRPHGAAFYEAAISPDLAYARPLELVMDFPTTRGQVAFFLMITR